MSKTFQLRDTGDFEALFEDLKTRSLGGEWEVVIQKAGKGRTLEQQALYWICLKLISEHTGHTPEQLHKHFKRTILLPILLRESEPWILKATAIREMRDAGLNERADQLARVLFSEVSTTSCTTKQMSEIMEHIQEVTNGFDPPIILPLGEKEPAPTPCPPDLCPECWKENKASPLGSTSPCSHQRAANPQRAPDKKGDDMLASMEKVWPMLAKAKQAAKLGDFNRLDEPCPCCADGTLTITIAGNGHTRGQCSTKGCISWIE